MSAFAPLVGGKRTSITRANPRRGGRATRVPTSRNCYPSALSSNGRHVAPVCYDAAVVDVLTELGLFGNVVRRTSKVKGILGPPLSRLEPYAPICFV
jgi:hypothetical protein